MGRTQQYQCIVLRTYDVGEADRFCILLTQERGKIAARAYGVRKPKSRMGGSLLALQQTTVTIHEGSTGMTVRSASCTRDDGGTRTLQGFLQAQQAVELLLSVLEDDHPVPEIFTLTSELLCGCRKNPEASPLAFTVRLLQTLGVLPREASHRLFGHCTEEELLFVESCSRGEWWLTSLPGETKNIRALCHWVMGEQTKKEMRAERVSAAVLHR
ncbi:DNA repair protein RecO [Candidatus Peregrinibacteria bacterium CG10_big_fil_rev_8_21_14_0_10_49_10]|nr:MAG: DNA repair protein RecO [Candidatus Peregrinibacteria bacterium CG10_big_fil_rev_8_21_14_0_10_49_10]